MSVWRSSRASRLATLIFNGIKEPGLADLDIAITAPSYCAVGLGPEGGDSNRGGRACLIKNDDQVILKKCHGLKQLIPRPHIYFEMLSGLPLAVRCDIR